MFLRTMTLPIHDELETPTLRTDIQNLTVKAGAPSMIRAGGRGADAGQSGLSWTGLICEIWKEVWILRAAGKWRWTQVVLMILSIS